MNDNTFYIIYCIFNVGRIMKVEGKSVMHDNMTKSTYYRNLNDVYLELVNQIQLLKVTVEENKIRDFVESCEDLTVGEYCKIKLDNSWTVVVEKHSYNLKNEFTIFKG